MLGEKKTVPVDVYYRTREIVLLLLLRANSTKFNFSLPHRNQHSITVMRAQARKSISKGSPGCLPACLPIRSDGRSVGLQVECGKTCVLVPDCESRRRRRLRRSALHLSTRFSAPQWEGLFSRALLIVRFHF